MDRTIMTSLVEAANLAPSAANCQPWTFWSDGTSLEIHFHEGRAKTFLDFKNLASWFSLGAVLANTSIRAEQSGYAASARLFLEKKNPSLAARVTFSANAKKGHPLDEFISKRSVNRRPYQTRALPPSVKKSLQALATGGVSLTLVEDQPSIGKISALLAEFDGFLFEHRLIHDGLYRWLRWTEKHALQTRDGMPVKSLEMDSFETVFMRLASFWPLAKLTSILQLSRFSVWRAKRLYLRSAAIGLLSIPRLSLDTVVSAGGVFQRLWLTLASQGIALQPVTGVVFLSLRFREEKEKNLLPGEMSLVKRAMDDWRILLPPFVEKYPIFMFRLGYAVGPTARALRLPLEKILALEGAPP